jgi:hypothetical protein
MTEEAAAVVTYSEPDNATTEYAVSVTVSGKNINSVRKQVERLFPGNKSVHVAKVKKDLSSAERLNEADTFIGEARGIADELRGELEELRDDLPASLRGGTKEAELDDAIEALESLEERLEVAEEECVNIKLPSTH